MVIGINKVIEKHAPLQKISRKLSRIRQKPWITKGLLISIKNKQKLYRNFFLKATAFGKHFYKTYANKLKLYSKEFIKKMYYTEFISKNKSYSKKMWEIINSAISTKSTISSFTKINIENSVIEDSSKIVDCFNEFFVEIGHSIANNVNKPLHTDYTTYLRNPVLHFLVLDHPNVIEIFQLINLINPNNINPFFLRIGAVVLAPILSIYLQWSFDLGIFPQAFKTVKVIPIFKFGSREILGNYRTIALISNLSKILKKLIKIRLDKFFFKNKVLYTNQYRFRNNHSVNHALLDVVTNCYDALHCSQHTAMLFMNLRKAFDTVSHKILLHKLHHYGIRGPAYALIENYLTSRNQFVTFINISFSNKPINIGVPQGSILGLLHFLIYINDLPNAINSTPLLFADDTCLILQQSSLSALEKACSNELIQVKDWCDANKIQINPNKSCVLHLPPKQNTPPSTFQIPYDNFFIFNSICCKYLGILIDNKLNFKHHRRRRRLKGIYSLQVRHKQDWGRGLSFYYPRLLHYPIQILAVMLSSQHRVSSSKTVRPRAPCGARCIGYAVRTWFAVCSEAPHSQFGEGARPHLCMEKWNHPTPVRRRLSLTQATRGKLIPTGLAPVPGTKTRSLKAFLQYSVFHL